MKGIRKLLAMVLAGTMVLSMGMVASAAGVDELFDATYYAQMNPDLVAVLGTDPQVLHDHFVTSGMAEGRCASALFDLGQYKANNPDLVKLFGDNNAAYYQHYVDHGIDEKRNAGALFNPAEYAEAYPEVVAAVGNDPEALFHHFLTAGLAEGKTKGLHFNAVSFAALNPELASKYGKDEVSMFKAYLAEGAAQGRRGVYTDRANKWYCDKKGEHTITKWIVIYEATCSTAGVQDGYCDICGEKETHVNVTDGSGHVNKNADNRCDVCGARLNKHVK